MNIIGVEIVLTLISGGQTRTRGESARFKKIWIWTLEEAPVVGADARRDVGEHGRGDDEAPRGPRRRREPRPHNQ